MNPFRILRPALPAAVAALVLLFSFQPSPAQDAPTSGQGSALSIPQAQLIQTGDLNRLLQSKASAQPLVLQVGSRILFDQAHIPGSIYAGPGSQPAGLQLLQGTVASVPKARSHTQAGDR